MNIVDFIETANWIISQYSDNTKNLLFAGTFSHHRVVSSRDPNKSKEFLTKTLLIIQDLAIVKERLLAHPKAQQVLTAFGLSLLTDKETALKIGRYASQSPKGDGPELGEDQEMERLIYDIYTGWNDFVHCLIPIQTLMIPKEVIEEKPFDDKLTIELDYRDSYPQTRTLSGVLDNITKLYEAFAVASGHDEFPPLVVIFAGSGSDFRFDLKGLGEPIKQLKAIFVDAWRLIRHRKADDFQKNGKAIIDGLNILDRIESSKRKKVLHPEEANRLKLHIGRAMLGLLEAGAMPREVPDTEPVQNRELMNGIHQRLLSPAPTEDEKKDGASKKKSNKTKHGKKKSDNSLDESDR